MKKFCCSVIWLFVFGIVGVVPVPQQPSNWYWDPRIPQLLPNCTSTRSHLTVDACDFWKLFEQLFERVKWDRCDCDQYAAWIPANEPPNEPSAIKLERLSDYFFYNVNCNIKADVSIDDEMIRNAMEFTPKLTVAIFETFMRNCFEKRAPVT